MEPSDLIAALEAAVRAADEEVFRLLVQHEDASRRLEIVEARLVEARQAQNAVKALLDQQKRTRKRPVPPRRNFAPTGSARTETTGSPLASNEPQVSPAPHKMSVAAQRVVEVLTDAPHPLRPADVLKAFEERGWVEKHWAAPAQSVYSALKRAEDLGLVARTDDSRWQISGQALALEPYTGARRPIRYACQDCGEIFVSLPQNARCPKCGNGKASKKYRIETSSPKRDDAKVEEDGGE